MRNNPIGWLCSTPFGAWTLLSINKMTPKKLIATPPAFLSVIGSFKKNAAMNMVKIGVNEVIMEASTGVVIVIALRKLICVRNNPNIDARKILGKSFRSTFSLGKKSERSQKQIVAPMARRQNMPIGEIIPNETRFLQVMMLNPNMVYAVNMAKCPNILDLSMLQINNVVPYCIFYKVDLCFKI